MDAVVFDFDGVICDSMPQHARAYREVLAPLDIPVSPRRVFELEGARSESVIRHLADEAGRPLADDEVGRLADDKQKTYLGLGQPSIYEGARQMVAAVAERAPIALVTGTRRDNLDHLIPDLLDVFRVVLAQDAYTHDKPHPEPYATAADQLGIVPSRCMAVENAPRGVQSAKAAGYGRVLAITTTVEAEDLREADAVYPDHAALLDGILQLVEAEGS